MAEFGYWIMPSGVCATYRDHMIVLTDDNFSAICDSHEFIKNEYDDRSQKFKLRMSRCLIFLHVWMIENPHLSKDMLSRSYATYQGFFENVFNNIYALSSDEHDINLVKILRSSILKFYSILGPYTDAFQSNIHEIHDVVDFWGMAWLSYTMKFPVW